MSATDDMLAANQEYASRFQKGSLPLPPARAAAVLICMDARIDPGRALGLDEGDAHVIRNAGGVASDDAIRSLIISHNLLGTKEYLVVHHTQCGMLTFQNDQLRDQLKQTYGADASGIDFLPFADLEESVREDVRRIRESPFLSKDITVSGYVYEVETGRLRPVT